MVISALPLSGSRWLTAAGVLGFAVALAAASQVAVSLPFTPVPMTLQPLAVVLAGLWLGPWAGAVSMMLYLAAGALGLPVFAPMGPPGFARLLGPTGGYLWAYPLAAWLAGRIGYGSRTFSVRLMGAAAGVLMLHIGGAAQLTVLTGDFERALKLGVMPFLLLDVVKVLAAATLSVRIPRESPRS